MSYRSERPLLERLDTLALAFSVLLERPCWATWGNPERPKAPCIAIGGLSHGRFANPSDPETWCTFAEARIAVEAGHFTGVGIMLTGLNGIAIFDFDDVRNLDTFELENWARPILNWMKPRTFTEISLSGTGFHVIALADENEPMRKGTVQATKVGGDIGKIEFWQNLQPANGRFIALTGDLFEGSPIAIGKIEGAADYFTGLLSVPSNTTANSTTIKSNVVLSETELRETVEIVRHVPPDIEYNGWLTVLQGVHHRFNGSEMGLQLADEWSARGAKYKAGDVSKRWRGFHVNKGVTWASVCSLAREHGASLGAISREAREAGFTETYNTEHGRQQAELLLDNQGFKSTASLKQKPPIELIHISELNVQEPEYLVDNMLEAGTLGVVFGAPGAGKSFVALDIAACIATGNDFHGRDCKQGRVIYVIGEGKRGVARRVKAWATDREIRLDKQVPFEVITHAVPMLSKDSLPALIEAINSSSHANQPPLLIVLDTLARNFGDGDENSTQDMTKFVNELNKVMHLFDCAVLIVHHSGHSAPERGRGSSVLKGAVESEFRIKQDDKGIISLEHVKAKDEELQSAMKFSLEPVELGYKRDGQPYGSAVLTQIEGIDSKTGKLPKSRLLAQQTFEDAALQFGQYSTEGAFHGVSEQHWRDVFMETQIEKSPDTARQAFSRARKTLFTAEHIELEGIFLVFAGPQKIARTLGLQELKRHTNLHSIGELPLEGVTCNGDNRSRHTGKAGDFVTDSPHSLKGGGVSHPDERTSQ